MSNLHPDLPDFSTVTEIGGEPVSSAQIARLIQRYYWAAEYCGGKDVLEAACGAGPGLGYLQRVARSVTGGDITPSLVERAATHYRGRVDVSVMDALDLPFVSDSLDVVILFEAIYYLPSADRFLEESRRVLRPGGRLLLATANCDLFDFNPSPFSTRYFGVPELDRLLRSLGFETAFYGGSELPASGVATKLLRVTKKVAVALHLIPKSMKGKRWLKRIVFGRLQRMPAELSPDLPYEPPVPLRSDIADRSHQVIYCAATLGVPRLS